MGNFYFIWVHALQSKYVYYQHETTSIKRSLVTLFGHIHTEDKEHNSGAADIRIYHTFKSYFSFFPP